VAARHPSVWRRSDDAPAIGTRRDLRPMPSAEPLPKPPVIERRASGASPRTVVTVRTFAGDDGDWRRWMAAHPEGFVLNRPRTTRATAMTLHRVGCPALGQLSGGGNGAAPATTTPKVCAGNAGSLVAWSRARGEGEPVPCRRCRP